MRIFYWIGIFVKQIYDQSEEILSRVLPINLTPLQMATLLSRLLMHEQPPAFSSDAVKEDAPHGDL